MNATPRSCSWVTTLLAILAVQFCGVIHSFAGNPYLHLSSDQPITTKFSGEEWGDSFAGDRSPLRAAVITKREAAMPWGELYRVSFRNIESKGSPKRTIQPLVLLVTDTQIALIPDSPAELERLRSLPKAPEIETATVRAIAKGKSAKTDGVTRTKLEVKTDTCTYSWDHNSGHSEWMLWKRGQGLVEYSTNQGAGADGFRLKRVDATK